MSHFLVGDNQFICTLQGMKTLVLKGFVRRNHHSGVFHFLSDHVYEAYIDSVESVLGKQCKLISAVPKNRDKRKSFKLLEFSSV